MRVRKDNGTEGSKRDASVEKRERKGVRAATGLLSDTSEGEREKERNGKKGKLVQQREWCG